LYLNDGAFFSASDLTIISVKGDKKMAKLERNRGMYFGSWTGQDIEEKASVSIGDSSGVTDCTVTAATFGTSVSDVSGEYTFLYDGSNWTLNGNVVSDISTAYGLSITGDPADGDILVVDYTAATSGWEALGKDNDDLSKELNPDTETSQNVLGETNFKHSGYTPEIGLDPYYIDPSRKMYDHLREVALEELYGEGDLMFNNMYIVNRELLIQLVTEAASLNQYSFVDTCLIQKGRELPIYCYRYDGFCRAANSMQAYFEISMRLLDPAVRSTLFPMDRPVYTRVQDEVPVKYGLSAAVSNSLVADGCIIEGRVENCIVFRGARIGHGAVVKNSIIMQGCYIGNGADLDYCICDKGVLVADNRRLAGYASYPLYLPRDIRV